MEIFSVIFLLLMAALVGIATALMVFAAGLWGGIGWLAFIAVIAAGAWFSAAGRPGRMTRETLSGPQQPLAKERGAPPRSG